MVTQIARLVEKGLLLSAPFALSAGLPLLASAQVPCTPIATTAGSLDTCFGINGYVQTDMTGTNGFQSPNVVRVQSDGRIVVGGQSRVAGSTGTELFVARY